MKNLILFILSTIAFILLASDYEALTKGIIIIKAISGIFLLMMYYANVERRK